MESYNIFYSWQSDYDYSKVYSQDQAKDHNQYVTEAEQLSQKKLIQKVLEWQAYLLGRKLKCNITVEMDTDDTPGMQPISDIVIKKISKCHLFVCDVTPVTSINREDFSKGRKLMPNSNVMYELGVAMSYLQPYQIIAIAHETTGTWIIIELPFDISHRKIIKFKTPTDLEKDLSSVLESSLRYYQSLAGKWKRIKRYFTKVFNTSPLKESESQKEQAALYNSEVFFNNRLAFSFPGLRGLKLEKMDLYKFEDFFKEPISNSDVTPMIIIDKFGKHPIKQFRSLGNKKFLIGDTEVFLPYLFEWQESNSCKCSSSFFVYRNRENPRCQFLYFVSFPVESVEHFDFINDEHVLDNNLNEYGSRSDVQEFAIFYGKAPHGVDIYTLTKEFYEDVSINHHTEGLFSQDGFFEFHRRYLNESRLMIVPTDSIIDNSAYNDIVEILSQYDSFDYKRTINELEKQLNEYFQTLVSTKDLQSLKT